MNTFRLVRPEDAEGIAAIYAPFVTHSIVSFEAHAPSADDMRARIADVGATYPWLVATDAGRVVGYAYASRHSDRVAYQWSANVTIYLGENYRGQGLGKRLYRVLFGLLKRQNIRSLYAGITLPNDASVRLHRTMGMSEVGIYRNVGFKHGAWHDVVWLGLSFDDDRPPNGPPVPIGTLPQNEVNALLAAAK